MRKIPPISPYREKYVKRNLQKEMIEGIKNLVNVNING